MRDSLKARVQTPPLWPVSEDEMRRQFDSMAGEVVEYGRSVLDRPLRLVHRPNPGAQRLWITGGAHGHEPGGCAACFNVLHIAATGKDLRGKAWPQMEDFARQLELVVVPCQNVDARFRCPDGFVGLTRATVQTIGQGVDLQGKTLQKEAGLPDGLNLAEVSFIGTLYNEAGYSFNRVPDYESTPVVEVEQMLEVMEQFPPDCCMDLHACGSNVMMMVRNLPEPLRETVRKIDAACRETIRGMGHQYADELVGSFAQEDTGVVSHLRIVHRRHGSVAFVYEGRQGYLDRLPRCGYDDILDDYLAATRETMRVGVEESFKP
jgi:hypothetical protein